LIKTSPCGPETYSGICGDMRIAYPYSPVQVDPRQTSNQKMLANFSGSHTTAQRTQIPLPTPVESEIKLRYN